MLSKKARFLSSICLSRYYSSGDTNVRLNDFHVPMIDERLRKRLFGDYQEPKLTDSIYRNALGKISEITKTKEFDYILHETKNFNKKNSNRNSFDDSETNKLPFRLPKLASDDLRDHFELIAEDLVNDYKNLLLDFAELSNIPPMPTVWAKTVGWTKYEKDGSFSAVEFPDDNVLVFDVETCVMEGSPPVMATAVSKDFWYSWCSARLLSDDNQNMSALSAFGAYQLRFDDLIPLESTSYEKYNDFQRRKRIIIGHYVSFDRSYVREQYYIEGTKLRFFDTMSAHIAVNGLAGDQRIAFMLFKSLKNQKKGRPPNKNEEKVENNDNNLSLENEEIPGWADITSMNNLADVHKLYCEKTTTLHVDKEKRKHFVDGQLEDIRKDFTELMTYCATDVAATFEIYKHLVKELFDRLPSAVTLFGMLELSVPFLTVNENWNHYIQAAQETFQMDDRIAKNILRNECNRACRLIENEKYKNDIWMFNEDWSLKSAPVTERGTFSRKVNEKPEDYIKRLWNKSAERKIRNHPSTFPAWHRKLQPRGWDKFEIENWNKSKQELYFIEDGNLKFDLTSRQHITPKILRLTWHGFPLYKSKSFGWGYLKLNEKKLANFNQSSFKISEYVEFPLSEFVQYIRQKSQLPKLDDECLVTLEEFKNAPVEFYLLPHPDGHGEEGKLENFVGNPLAKPFIHFVEQGVLCSQDQEKLSSLIKLAKKCSYWQNNHDRIMEQIIIWLDNDKMPDSLHNKNETVGIILPRLIISGTVTRRAVEKLWMTVSNAKSDRTGSELKGIVQTPPGYCFVGADVDSQELWIAGLLGDSSKHKIHGCTPFGYMTLKGNKADKTDQHTIVSEQLKVSRDQAKVMVDDEITLYGAGVKYATLLLQQFRPSDDKMTIKASASNLYKLTKGEQKYQKLFTKYGKYLKTMKYWDNGSESDLFNCLERIAGSDHPKTPVLKCRISKALEPGVVEGRYLPSRVNWIIQSSAVDFLHSMLTCMRWLCDKYDIDVRFALSVHDEVRYFVKEEDKYRAALALQFTNLLTRAFFVKSVDMQDLPASVAFFSKVDIDKVLRKEVDDDNITPSNPLGLHKCYGVATGEALTMDEIVAKTGGTLKKKSESI